LLLNFSPYFIFSIATARARENESPVSRDISTDFSKIKNAFPGKKLSQDKANSIHE
jgi:hypothetical protein